MTTKKTLYLGIESPNPNFVHNPIIITERLPINRKDCQHMVKIFNQFSHVFFSSKNVVRYLYQIFKHYQLDFNKLNEKKVLSIGQETSKCLLQFGITPFYTSVIETTEGLLKVLTNFIPIHYLLWPHSSLSRTVLSTFCKENQIPLYDIPIYSTKVNPNFIVYDLNLFDEIIFTSPSCVDAFQQFYSSIPQGIKLTPIGPITEQKLKLVKL
ncbi:MAG: hypothetical protein BGO10_07760 [Chlamydia sp. 32-24]|nr:MAG: hypothetical protein BGO10_07760 [Chlamydia sp. 32-24]